MQGFAGHDGPTESYRAPGELWYIGDVTRLIKCLNLICARSVCITTCVMSLRYSLQWLCMACRCWFVWGLTFVWDHCNCMGPNIAIGNSKICGQESQLAAEQITAASCKSHLVIAFMSYRKCSN